MTSYSRRKEMPNGLRRRGRLSGSTPEATERMRGRAAGESNVYDNDRSFLQTYLICNFIDVIKDTFGTEEVATV